MNLLLIFFVLPLAVIIFSIALEIILNRPVLVSAVIFAIFLIVAFIAFGGSATAIIAAIIYAILALIVAFITNIISDFIDRNCNNSCKCHDNNDDDDDDFPNTRACRICRCQRNILRGIQGR